MSSKGKSSGVLIYFDKVDGDGYICQIEKNGDICAAKLGLKMFNLKRHIERHHPDIFKAVLEEEQLKRKEDLQDSGTSNQQMLSKYFHSEKINVSMTKEKFKRHLIQLVVDNGVALTLFSSPAFVGLHGEMAEKLGVSLSSIRNMIICEAEKQKDKLKEELRDKFLFLKLDACTSHRINYFAVNAQFVDSENKVSIFTLAVKDTENQHSSDFIKKLVEDVLNDFDISKQQVLAIVTDNASNMILAVEKLSEDSVADENEDDVELEDAPTLDEITTLAFTYHSEFKNMSHMRCAAHTLQLAIRDGLKVRSVDTLICKIRQVVIAARAPKIDAILKRKTKKGAILDQATRWGSTYLMLERLLELKPVLVDIAHPNVSLSDVEWNEIKKLEELLRHPFLTTKKLQASDLTPGSFFKEWKKLLFQFSQLGGNLADAIRTSMERREKALLTNDVLLAAVYVDPMYRVILNDEQHSKGKATLLEIALSMKDYERRRLGKNLSQGGNQTEDGESENTSTTSEEEDFEKHLDRQAKIRKTEAKNSDGNSRALQLYKIDFNNALSSLENIDRTSKVAVMDAISMYPDIVQEVAYSVTALPPTQGLSNNAS